MKYVDESSFVAHALRDYLRPFVDDGALSFIDSPLMCGEPLLSIDGALAVAVDYEVPLPDVYIQHILALVPESHDFYGYFTEYIAELPKLPIVA